MYDNNDIKNVTNLFQDSDENEELLTWGISGFEDKKKEKEIEISCNKRKEVKENLKYNKSEQDNLNESEQNKFKQDNLNESEQNKSNEIEENRFEKYKQKDDEQKIFSENLFINESSSDNDFDISIIAKKQNELIEDNSSSDDNLNNIELEDKKNEISKENHKDCNNSNIEEDLLIVKDHLKFKQENNDKKENRGVCSIFDSSSDEFIIPLVESEKEHKKNMNINLNKENSKNMNNKNEIINNLNKDELIDKKQLQKTEKTLEIKPKLEDSINKMKSTNFIKSLEHFKKTIDIKIKSENNKIKENKLEPIILHINNKILIYKVIDNKKYKNGIICEEKKGIFKWYKIEKPKDICEDIILKNLIQIKKNTEINIIEEMVGIKKPIKINECISLNDKFFMKLIKEDLKDFGKFFYNEILKDGIKNEEIKSIMRVKLGLIGKINYNKFESNYMRHIIEVNQRELCIKFVNDQEKFLYFFIIFYKKGLVRINDFPERFINNIFCNKLLHKINNGEEILQYEVNYFKEREQKNKLNWSLKNILDFGISKIMDVGENDKIEKLDDIKSINNIIVNKNDKKLNNTINILNSNVNNNEKIKSNINIKNYNENKIILNNKKINEDNKNIENKINLNNLKEYKDDSILNLINNNNKFKSEGLYKKKFSKSFVDIFAMETKNNCNKADLGSFLDDVNENDKPILIKEFEQEAKRSVFNVFGLFKKKSNKLQQSLIEDELQDTSKPNKIFSDMKMTMTPKDIYANKKTIIDNENQ